MIRILLTLLMVLVVLPVHAQTWHTANQATVGWDPVAPIVATDTIKYQVYTKFSVPSASPQPVGSETLSIEQVISFSVEGRYYICVETVRYPSGETEPQRSDRMACSDIATDTSTGTPFGIKYFTKPNETKNLRVR